VLHNLCSSPNGGARSTHERDGSLMGKPEETAWEDKTQVGL